MTERAEADERAGMTVDLAVRLAGLGLLAAWCFALLKPFIAVVVWGAILAVALGPLFRWLEARLGGRGTLAAVLMTGVGIAVILGPVGLLLANLATSAEALVAALASGDVQVPPPPASVATWPLVGGPVFELWSEASESLDAVADRYAPHLQRLATALLGLAATAGLSLLQLLVAMVLAGLFLPNAAAITGGLGRLVDRLTPTRGKGFVALAGATVRNVARGVVGIALLQGLLLGLGFLGAGIPFAGVWTLACMVLTIVQVGPGLIVLGTLIYAWTSLGTLTALLFTLWMVPMTLLDNVLKPIVMGRGLPVPMVVIFLGVIGGTLLHGLVGLFVGPVVLALGYELLRGWVRADEPEAAAPPAADR